MSLDTLRIARELRDADLAPAQAEAIATAIGNAVSDGAASKADIEVLIAKIEAIETKLVSRFDSLEQRIGSEIGAQEQRLIAKLETMRSSILVWLIGIVIASAGLLLTIGRIYFSP